MSDAIDTELRSQIIKILAEHQKWREDKPGGKRGSLAHRDFTKWTLSGLDLSLIDLCGTCFSHADLEDANLQGAILIMADLLGAKLQRANLMGADLRGARLKRANLNDARMDGANLGSHGDGSTARATDLGDATMRRSILLNTSLSECDMSGADLSSCDLEGADMSGSILVGARLTDVRAENTSFNGAMIFGAELDDTLKNRMIDCGASASLPKPTAEPAEIIALHKQWLDSDGRSGQRCDIDMLDFTGMDFSGADLTSAIIRRCNLRGAVLRETVLDLADLSLCDLTEADLSNSVLNGTNCRRTNFTRARFHEARIGTVPIEGRKWPTNMERALLHAAEFDQAHLEQTIFRGTRTSADTVRSLHEAGVPAVVLQNATRVVVEAAGAA